MVNNEKFKRLLKVEEVAEMLAASSNTIYSWAKSRKIPAFKANGLLRFDPEEIREWLEESRIKDNPAIKVEGKNVSASDIDNIIKEAIASTKSSGYTTPTKGKPGQSSPERRV